MTRAPTHPLHTDARAGAAVRGLNTAVLVFLMSRPSHLLLQAVVFLLGIAVARAHDVPIDPVRWAVGLAVFLPLAGSVHVANEYADHETDALTVRTPFSGGSGTLPRTGRSPALALAAAGALLAGGTALAVAAAVTGTLHPVAAALLALGTLGGWAYSVGPFPLGWHGLGEVTNSLLGGMVLPLYGVAVAGGAVDAEAALVFLPFTLLVGANLLATTWPDRDADARVGKRTLATRWPVPWLRAVYAATNAAFVAATVLLAPGPLDPRVAAASLLVVPLVGFGMLVYTRWRSPFPAVAAMVAVAIIQLAAWWAVG